MTSMKTEKKEEQSETSLFEDMADIIETVILSLFIVMLVFTYILRISVVIGPSMEPTLTEGDRLIVLPLCYTPEQNDVVVIDSTKLEKPIVKRIVALEGQSVDIDFEKGIVSVDGKELDEQLYVPGENGESPELEAHHFVNSLTTIDMGAFDSYPVTVPENCVFVLGDNRNRSKDSKHAELGFVPEEEIMGKAIMIAYPFSRFTKLD